MKHIWHLVGADVRRFRLLLIASVAIEVATTIFRWVRPTLAVDVRQSMAGDLLATLLVVTGWLAFLVVIPLVVQAHPLVGSDAFWMTRPIPWRSLLASKLVVLGTTFVLVPVLCEVALMLVSRVPARQIQLIAIEGVLWQGAWLLMAMALSAVTRNLARFALAIGGLLFALLVLIYSSLALMLRNNPFAPQVNALSERAATTGATSIVVIVLVLLTGLALLAVQYRTRSTRTSVGVGIAGIAAAVAFALLFPARVRPLAVPAWAVQESAIRLHVESPTGEFSSLNGGTPLGDDEGWQLGGIRLRMSGLEGQWLATLRLVDGTLQFGDGAMLRTAGNGYSSFAELASVGDSAISVATRQALGVTRMLAEFQGRSAQPTVAAIVLTEAEFSSRLGRQGTYRGRYLVDLDRFEVAGVLPLQVGAEYRDPMQRIVVDDVRFQAQAASVRARRFSARSIFGLEGIPELSFYLRNRETSEAVAGTTPEGLQASHGGVLPMFFGVGSYSIDSGGFAIRSHVLRFPEGYNPGRQGATIGRDWLSRAELVILRKVAGGSLTRTIEVPDFEVAAAPQPAAQ